VLFLGLENSGKTSIIDLLCTRIPRLVYHRPTARPVVSVLKLRGGAVRLLEMPQFAGLRQLVWRDYVPAMDGIVYVLDCADKQSMREAKQYLQELLANMPQG